MKKTTSFFLFFFIVLNCFSQTKPSFRDTHLPLEKRVDDLISKLSLDEKISLLLYNSPGVPRLKIPAYNWWNEALHGVARAGRATVFPQAIGMAASFDDDLIKKVADAISDEARAKYNEAIKNNNRSQYLGLTFWSPNINIFRDPRWGRGHETYGEDPYLTGRIGTAFVKGIQGNDPDHLKAVACAKHFAVHSGPEPIRHEFNAVVSNADLRNTYLPAFRQLVVNAKVGGVMCAYNRTDSLPCCGSKLLLQDILRNEWGFNGYVVTDCWALDDIFRYHKFVKTEEEAAAIAINNGVNVECGNTLKALRSALDKELVTEKAIDLSLKRNLEILFKLGWFDPANESPYSKINSGIIDNKAHKDLAKKAAAESMVLLSNKNKVLPLSSNIKKLLVTGPNADESNVLLANYNGNSSNLVTILEGITGAVSPSTVIFTNKGCELTDTSRQDIYWMIDDADAVVAVMGLSPLLEGENGDANLSQAGGDKKDISFPYAQLKYLRALRARTNKPLIVVLTTGSAVELEEVEKIADAVLLAWYPGEQGGNAVADILFGKTSPSGRLPVTFYRSNNDLPAFEDYSMKGRTYRYFSGKAFHPFGFGLSYTNFDYSNGEIKMSGNVYSVSLDIKNTGKMDGDEVVQLYIRRSGAGKNEPLMQLKDFKRVSLAKGQTKKLHLSFTRDDLQYWDETKDGWMIYPGEYEVMTGPSSGEIKVIKKISIQ